MGFSIKFHWVLQLEVPESLALNHQYPFAKFGNSMLPIDLQRNAIAKIKVLDFTNTSVQTTDALEVVKIYTSN